MRKNLLALSIAAVIGACGLAACTSVPSSSGTAPSPAQIQKAIAGACPSFQSVLSSLSALQGLPPAAVNDLAVANNVVPAACAATATVNVANVQALATTAAPALIAVINASTLQAQQKNEAILAVSAGQIIVTGVIAASQAAGVSTAPASAQAPAASASK